MKRAEVLSNLAYLVAGVVALVLGHVVVAIALVSLAITSALYHLTHHRDWRIADRYFVVGTVVALMYELGMLGPIAASVAALLAVYPAVRMVPLDPFVIAGVGLAAGYIWPKSWLPLALMALAGTCAKRAEAVSFFTGTYQLYHSLWHLLSALAVVTALHVA